MDAQELIDDILQEAEQLGVEPKDLEVKYATNCLDTYETLSTYADKGVFWIDIILEGTEEDPEEVGERIEAMEKLAQIEACRAKAW